MSKNINEMVEKLLSINTDENLRASSKLPIISEGIKEANAYESEILDILCNKMNDDNTNDLMKYFHDIKNEYNNFLSILSSEVIKHIIALNDIEKEILEYKKENEEEKQYEFRRFKWIQRKWK